MSRHGFPASVGMPLLLLLAAASVFSVPVSLAEENCVVKLPDDRCFGDPEQCVEKRVCHHGTCDPNSGCVCDPCWTGNSCNEYVDRYGPMFATREAFYKITSSPEGLSYALQVNDEDLGLTCPLGVAGPPARCPCSEVEYHLVSSELGSDAVELDPETGVVTVTDLTRLDCSRRYRLQIEARAMPPPDAGVKPHRDSMNLTLYCAADLDAELRQALQEANEIEAEALDVQSPPQSGLEELTRQKRASAGDNPEDTTMELVRTSDADVSSPKVGALLEYEFTITLPTVNNMDMVVEAFVANLDTGHSVFNILSMAVTFSGSEINSNESAASTANAFTGASGQVFKNANNPDIVDRAIINLGSLTNADSSSGGATDASKIKIAFSAIVVHNTEVSAGTQQYVSIGAEYSGSSYVQISQEAFTPDSTSTDISSSVGSLSASSSMNVPKYSASYAEITLPVAAALGTVQVEAFIAGIAEEDALSIGGAFVELGADFLEPRAFNGDDFRTSQILSESGATRQVTSFEFNFAQSGAGGASSSDAGRAATIKIPVYATSQAVVDSTGLLVVFVRVKDRMTDSWVNAGESTKVSVVVVSGTPPSPAGSLTLVEGNTLISDSKDVATGSVVEFDVVVAVSSGDAFIASETITLNTASTTGLRACSVEVISQGTNIVYIESTSIEFTPEDGETSAVLTVTGLHSTEMISDAKGNELKFRLAVRADASGAGTYSLGGNTYNLASVNATGDPSGTQPTVTVSSSSGNTVYIGSQFGIDLTILYGDELASTDDPTQDKHVLEFVSDLRTQYEVDMCSVHVVSVGRDLPCARSKLTEGLEVTHSQSNSSREHNDVAATSLPATCASKRSSSTDADRTIIVRAVGQVVAGQTLTETTFNPGAGMVFDENTLYAALVGDMTLAAALTSYTGGSGDPTITIPSPGPLTYGKVHMVNALVYIPPGGHSPKLSLTATSGDPAAFRIDRIYVKRVGRNFGCLKAQSHLVNLDKLRVTDPAAEPETYPAFSVDADQVLGSSATIELGAISNVGSTSDPGMLNTVETTDVLVRDNHIVLEVAVQALMDANGVVPGDGTFDLTVSGKKDASADITPATITLSFSGSDTPYSASDPALVTSFTPKDDSTIYKSIPKLVELKATLPEGFYGTLKVRCEHPSSDSSQWEVKGAAPLRPGQNLHGLWFPEIKAERTTSDLGGMELITQADLELRDVTRLETLSSPSDEDSQLRVACVVLVPATTDASGSISVKVTLLDGADTEIGSSLETSLTISADEYSPSSEAPTFSVNQTIDLSNNTVTPSANIGEHLWLPFQLIVPPGTHGAELAVVSDSDQARAFMTVHGIRYGPNIGSDVMGLPVLTEELVNLTQTNRNLTSQLDTALLNWGFISNIDLSSETFRGKSSDASWGVDMEVQLQVTDHPELHSSATATKPVYISFKLGDFIVVETQEVTATMTGSEKIILETQLELKQPEKIKYDKETDQKVGLTVTMKHSNTSTQEAMDAREVVIFPPYMNYTEGEVETNSTSITVMFKGNSVALVVGDILFTDIFTVNFNASIDPNKVRSPGSGWTNATTLARPICKPTGTNKFQRCGPMAYVMYEINNPECSEPLLAALQDCHFSVSAAMERGGSYGAAAIRADGWRLPVRDDPSWTNQYVEIRFDVPTRISGWKVINVGARKVTEVALMASDDGHFFQKKYTGTVTDNMDKEDLGDSSFSTSYVRIVITAADADVSNYLQIRAELYGCFKDAEPDSTCPSVDDNTIYSTEPRKWRHFAVDTTNKVVYFCDYHMMKDAMVCFASRDDAVWIRQPGYIGQLRGHSDGKMYAHDSKLKSTLSSTDGEHWQVVAPSDVPATFDPVMVVKGTTAADSSPVSQGGYEGDYFGIKKTGGSSYLVKWSKCCSN